MTSIAIVGDSFGCGEWAIESEDKSLCTHKGSEYFLQKIGYDVKNYSKPSSSNQQILEQIKSNKIKNQWLIVFASESLRKIQNLSISIEQMYLKKKYSIKKIHETLFLDWANNLSNLTKKQSCNVILIGGHANIYKSFIPSNHVTILTHSWISDILNTAIGDLSSIDHKTLDFFMTLNSVQSDEQKLEMIDIITQKSKRLNKMANHPNFKDNVHPDRICHEKLSYRISKIIG